MIIGQWTVREVKERGIRWETGGIVGVFRLSNLLGEPCSLFPSTHYGKVAFQ